jgi:hypothetical protein
MYVRIIRSRDGVPKQTLIETDRLDVHPLPKEPHRILLDVGEDTNHHGVHKAYDKVYVMNEDGKTVDTYTWPVQPTGNKDASGEEICTGDQIAVRQDEETWRSGQVKKNKGEPVVEYNGSGDKKHEPLDPIPKDQILLLTALEERMEEGMSHDGMINELLVDNVFAGTLSFDSNDRVVYDRSSGELTINEDIESDGGQIDARQK